MPPDGVSTPSAERAATGNSYWPSGRAKRRLKLPSRRNGICRPAMVTAASGSVEPYTINSALTLNQKSRRRSGPADGLETLPNAAAGEEGRPNCAAPMEETLLLKLAADQLRHLERADPNAARRVKHNDLRKGLFLGGRPGAGDLLRLRQAGKSFGAQL